MWQNIKETKRNRRNKWLRLKNIPIIIEARLQIPYPIYNVTKMAKISYRHRIYDQNG